MKKMLVVFLAFTFQVSFVNAEANLDKLSAFQVTGTSLDLPRLSKVEKKLMLSKIPFLKLIYHQDLRLIFMQSFLMQEKWQWVQQLVLFLLVLEKIKFGQ